LLGSVVLHGMLIAASIMLSHSPTRSVCDAPIAFAVTPSLLSQESPPEAVPPPPPCEVQAEPDDLEPPLPVPAVAEIPPPAPAAVCTEPLLDHEPPPPSPLAQLARQRVTRRAAPLLAELTAPRELASPPAPTPPSPAPSPARPEVLVPVPGENPSPDYPAGARRRGVEGTVIVRILVAADGLAADCSILTSSGNALLDDAALRAARRWRFQSGPGVVEQPFRFELIVARAKA